MTKLVYLIGYTGSPPARIEQLVTELDATLVDIRFQPRSHNPVWNRHALAQRLGERYVHCGALGNADYQQGGMRIADFDAGLAVIEASPRPVILMCACAAPEHCHRTVVGERLADLGFEVVELNAPLRLPLD